MTNNIQVQTMIAAVISMAFCMLFIPVIIQLSLRFGLVDKPNERKVHKQPIPRLGGVGIFISALAGIVVCHTGLQAISRWPVFFSVLALLFLTGVWDDLKDISARLRFVIQVCCALALASTGIRLTSLHGIFGITTLLPFWQYIMTVLIVVGVTNAFNLIDGVDGLAGGLGLINTSVLAYLSLKLQLYPLLIVLVAFGGSLIGFLKNNISPARIFMGDGGSLVLGCLMSSSGIILIERAHAAPQLMAPGAVAVLVTAILIIPVFDSLRVFSGRLLAGKSPLKADKTHIHHLLLVAGLDHRRTCLLLYTFEILMITMAALLPHATGVSYTIVAMVLGFHIVTKVLWLNQEVEKWLKIVKGIETEGLR
jgi:UDP-GlcNAc:undecaprenyl-phosphate GlcNAc-1-phosphate transferase